MDFIFAFPDISHIEYSPHPVLDWECNVKLYQATSHERSAALNPQLSRLAAGNYPTPAQVFEEIGWHLTCWLTLALVANLLLAKPGA
jgi:hypothetical protein